MPTPIAGRVNIADALPRGRYFPGGAASFVAHFSNPDTLGEFMKWRDNPVTLLFINALHDLAATPPAGYISKDDIGVQFGVQSGILMSAQLANDPTALFPTLFSAPTSGVDGVKPMFVDGYTSAPDGF